MRKKKRNIVRGRKRDKAYQQISELVNSIDAATQKAPTHKSISLIGTIFFVPVVPAIPINYMGGERREGE